MSNIQAKVYVTKKVRTPPISVVYGATGVGIDMEIMDYDLPAGSTAEARASGKFAEEVYKNSCTVDGNTITMYPDTGFFVPGGNEFQVVIAVDGKNILSFVMDVYCDKNLGEGNDPATPEQVLPLVQRAENAAAQSEAAAARAEEVKNSIQEDYTELSDGVNQLKDDLTQIDDSVSDMRLGIQTLNRLWFDRGTLDGSGAVLSTGYQYRVRTKDIHAIDTDINITRIEDGFRANVYYFGEDDTYESTEYIMSAPYTIPALSRFKIVIRRITEVTSEIADISTFVSALSWTSSYESRMLSVEKLSSDNQQAVEDLSEVVDERTMSGEGKFIPVIADILSAKAIELDSGKVKVQESSYEVCSEFDVKEGEIYRATYRVNGMFYSVVFADAENMCLGASIYEFDGTGKTYDKREIVVPSGAVKMFVNSAKAVPPKVDKFSEISEKEYIRRLVDFEENRARAILAVMSYNVGCWYCGEYRPDDKTDLMPDDDVLYENYIGLHQSIIDRYSPDVICFQEYTAETSMGRKEDADTFIGQFYRNLNRSVIVAQDEVSCATASKLKLHDYTATYYAETSDGNRCYTKAYIYVNGRKVCICNTHLSNDVNGDQTIKKAQAAELLEALKDEEYLILFGDFNSNAAYKSLEQYSAVVGLFEQAVDDDGNHKYKLCNGGEFGVINTNGERDGAIGANDHIIVTSNISIKSAFADTQKDDADFVDRIDHRPLVAYLEIY